MTSQKLDPQAIAVVRPDELRWVEFHPTSLRFDRATPIEVWQAVTERLIYVGRRIQWWIADALAFGESAYGERYSQVLKTDAYTYETLRNMAWIARSIDVSRRRDTVPFSLHAEVAPLAPDDQVAFLAICEEQGTNRQELRERVQEHRRARAREAALAAPVPSDDRLPVDVRLAVADARHLPLDDGVVDVTITSPPYGLDVAYPQGDVDAADWPSFMYDWLVEDFRVTREGGRLALNVPLDTTKGGRRPTYAQAIEAALRAGWTYGFTIEWREDNISKSVARGSVDSPHAVHVAARVEMIAVFSRGAWHRDPKGRVWDLGHDEWLEYTNGTWTIAGESAPWEGGEAAFPPELPRRLVKLLSFTDDVICDPFLGTGTTAVVAARLGRPFVGYDIAEAQVGSAKRRLAAAMFVKGLMSEENL